MMLRVQDARGGSQRIHRRINAQRGDVARQVGGGVQVREGRGGSRVGVIVGGHVDGLHRRDGALLGGSDALLQFAHFGGQVGLVTDGRRHAAEQRRNFRARLREPENVVDEEQHVLMPELGATTAVPCEIRATRRAAVDRSCQQFSDRLLAQDLPSNTQIEPSQHCGRQFANSGTARPWTGWKRLDLYPLSRMSASLGRQLWQRSGEAARGGALRFRGAPPRLAVGTERGPGTPRQPLRAQPRADRSPRVGASRPADAGRTPVRARLLADSWRAGFRFRGGCPDTAMRCSPVAMAFRIRTPREAASTVSY